MGLRMGVARGLDVFVKYVAVHPSASYSIDAQDVAGILSSMQKISGVKVTSIDVTPVIQYNGMEEFPSCAPGPKPYEPVPILPFISVRDISHEAVCMLVRYVAHFENGYSRKEFLHAPMQLKFGRDLPLLHEIDKAELSDYVKTQTEILKQKGLAVNVKPLQYYHGDGGQFGFDSRWPMKQDRAA